MLKIDNNTLVKMNKYVGEQHKKYIGLRDECYELERKLQLLRYTRDKINHEISILKPYSYEVQDYSVKDNIIIWEKEYNEYYADRIQDEWYKQVNIYIIHLNFWGFARFNIALYENTKLKRDKYTVTRTFIDQDGFCQKELALESFEQKFRTMDEAESQIKKLLEQTNYYILNAAITKNYIAAFGTGFIDLSKVYDKTEA